MGVSTILLPASLSTAHSDAGATVVPQDGGTHLLSHRIGQGYRLELISKAISMLGQVLVADEDAGDAEHGQEGGGLALPAHVQPAVGAQPGIERSTL